MEARDNKRRALKYMYIFLRVILHTLFKKNSHLLTWYYLIFFYLVIKKILLLNH